MAELAVLAGVAPRVEAVAGAALFVNHHLGAHGLVRDIGLIDMMAVGTFLGLGVRYLLMMALVAVRPYVVEVFRVRNFKIHGVCFVVAGFAGDAEFSVMFLVGEGYFADG